MSQRLPHFKQFNDAHGHQAGDRLLREIAQVIVAHLRAEDSAYRYGGEEFAVILPTSEALDGCLAAERIRQMIEQHVETSHVEQFKVTVSIGVAAAIQADDPEQMIRRADQALYKAKQSGRNCVCWHNGKEILPVESQEMPPVAERPKSEWTQNSHPTSITALNCELTRHVCESRRLNTPLSLVCVRIEALHKFERSIDSIEGASILPAVIRLIRGELQATDLLIPIGATELILVLPGCTQHAAVQVIENCVECGSGKELHRTHNFRLRYEACEILPNETAEELLVRARESVLAASGA